MSSNGGKRLKCIGGIWDGRTAELRHGYRQLTARSSPRLDASFDLTNPPPFTVHYREMTYVIDVVHAQGEDIEFLRPEDWTAEQTLRHALGPA